MSKGSLPHNCEAYILGVGNMMNDIAEMHHREGGVGVASKRGNMEVTTVTVKELQANALVQSAERIRPICSACADKIFNEAMQLSKDGGFKLRVKVTKNRVDSKKTKGVTSHVRLSTVNSRGK